MSIKRFNEYHMVNEAIGSSMLQNVYTIARKLRGEALEKYRKAAEAYNTMDRSDNYDSSLYGKKNRAEQNYKEMNEHYQSIHLFINALSQWGMDIETLDDNMIEVIDETKGDDSTKLRRKPYSSDDYIVLALEEVTLVDTNRDSAINDVLDDEPNKVFLPIGYFRSTWAVYGAENRKELLERGTLFYVMKPTRDATREEIMNARRERKSGIVQPNDRYGDKQSWSGNSMGGYDLGVKSANIKRYADKLASKRNFDHLHDIMVDTIKAKNRIEEDYLDSLKTQGDSYSRANESGLKEAIVQFVNSHPSSITLSSDRLYNETSTSILNNLFNSYISAFKTVNKQNSHEDKTSSLKTLGGFDELLPDLLKFVKEFKPKKKN